MGAASACATMKTGGIGLWGGYRNLPNWTCMNAATGLRIQSKSMGIDAKVRFFVPLDAPIDIWGLTLRNQGETPAEISLFSAFQLSPARKLMLKYGWTRRRLSVAAVRRVGTRPEMAG